MSPVLECPACGSADPSIRRTGRDRGGRLTGFACRHDWHEELPPGLEPESTVPVPIRLPCPACGALHLDVGEFATKAHHTHACQECGMVWRPAVVPTVGVAFLPGFKDDGGSS